MNWDAIGASGEIIAAIAVVVSIVYLSMQVRQANNSVRAESRQSVAFAMRDSMRLLMDPGLSSIYSRGQTEYSELSPEEKRLFAAFISDQALTYQAAFALFESGQLDESTYLTYLKWFASMLALPGGKHWWETMGKPVFVPEMVTEVDKYLAKGDVLDLRESDQFKP